MCAAKTLVITGTDTGVGKTYVSSAILRTLRADGLRVCGFKPVASGCERTSQGWCNDDALALQAAAGTQESYAHINPYAFEPAIAPHLAAAAAHVTIETARLDDAHAQLAARYDLVLIEGAGGWQVPLNDTTTFADWVTAHQWPVLLVVGMRLGCLNHALLSAESIARRTRLAGWVANALPQTMPMLHQNIATLDARMLAPRLDPTDSRALQSALAGAGCA